MKCRGFFFHLRNVNNNRVVVVQNGKRSAVHLKPKSYFHENSKKNGYISLQYDNSRTLHAISVGRSSWKVFKPFKKY